MKEIDKIKIEIGNINDPVEMAGYLDGIRTAAMLYCKNNHPEEVVIENGRITDLTIYGMVSYLKSDVNQE